MGLKTGDIPANERSDAQFVDDAPDGAAFGTEKEDIAEAKETSITIRAVMAGFAKFCPMPPKN